MERGNAMSVITAVHIQNFQSHRNTKLKFDHGINAIVGPSNSGKSAILRAMEWVLLNSPSGTDFISMGEDFAEVTIFLENGYAVSRRRTRSNAVNTYTLLHNGEVLPEGVLTGFGSHVPPQVAEVLGMSRLQFGIAKQLEAPFLISETPKVRAETIGNLEELGKIDRALQSVNEDIRDQSKRQKELDVESKRLGNEVQKLEKELKHDQNMLSTFEQYKQKYEHALQLTQTLFPKSERLRQLSSNLIEINDYVFKAFKIKDAWNQNAMDAAQLIERISQSAQRIQGTHTSFDAVGHIDCDGVLALEQQFKTLQDAQRIATLAEQSMQQVGDYSQKLNTHREKTKFISLPLDQAEMAIASHSAMEKLYQQTKHHHTELVEAHDERTKYTKELHQSLQRFMDALQEAQVCPLCEQSTQHTHQPI